MCFTVYPISKLSLPIVAGDHMTMVSEITDQEGEHMHERTQP